MDRREPGKAIPYGIYDVAANSGWVSVGTDHDTAAFTVASIRRWWQARGRHDYPQAAHLLITAGAGGSNGCRTRVWKTELAALAAETGLDSLQRRYERKAEHFLAFVGIPQPSSTTADSLRRQQRLRSMVTSRVGHRLGETWRCQEMPSEAFLVS